MRYAQSRIFPALESFDPDLSFFHVDDMGNTSYPPEADQNMGDSTFTGIHVEDLTDTIEHIEL